MRTRTTLGAAVLLAAAGTTALTAAGRIGGRRVHPLSATGRAQRNAQVASLSARVGAATAASRARAVFASAERKEQLATELQLRTAAEVATTLGQMKGALMKIGQMASYLDEGLPEPVRAALSQLQSDAPPMSYALAAEVVERELGAPPEKLFATFDPVPIAAASIGQVHRAITFDDQAVAVKVQYPGVAEAISSDLGNADLVFGALAMAFPGLDPAPITAELRERISEELDYRLEAANQQLFAEFYRDHPFIHVPAVRHDLSSARVLTTELATGSTFPEVCTWPQDERDLAAEALFRFVFRSLYRLGAFNGDPHPGNYLFRPGGRITFLDFGLVRRFEPPELARFEAMVTNLVLRRDKTGFRRAVENAGLLASGAEVSDDEVAEFFGHFYAFVAEPGRFTMTPEYASATVRQTFKRSSPVTRYTTVPASFVLIQRINLGIYALLGHLGATADWRGVAEELWPWVNAPASTPLGQEEARWLAAR